MTELIDHDAWEIAAAVRTGEASRGGDRRAVARAARGRHAGSGVGGHPQARPGRGGSGRRRACRGPRPGSAGRSAGGMEGPDRHRGIRTTYGSAIYADHVPDRDADVVARHTAAGAVCVAKLATHEFAWSTTTQNPHFGGCRNPHDPTRVPGGSSGGSGAAVAAGMVPLAPGTDTGGSIRCPASCCGIVGLKPTFGRVSLAGIHPLCISLDHCGPMARSVRDCALSLEVMAGPSVRDPPHPAGADRALP